MFGFFEMLVLTSGYHDSHMACDGVNCLLIGVCECFIIELFHHFKLSDFLPILSSIMHGKYVKKF